MPIKIQVIRKSRQLNAFLKLPWQIYRGDPNWVPPLLSDHRKILHPQQNPFFQHGQITRLLAVRDGKPVGRICAIDNRAHIDYWQEPVGFFGFFECENNQETANALINAAAEWLYPRGLNVMRGPMNLSTNDTCGLLVDGYDSPPVFMMTYNPPYYEDLLLKAGFSKSKDLWAYKVTKEDVSERLMRSAEKIKERSRVTIRSINVKHLFEDIELVRIVYNQAWSKNWGFVPMTAAEFDHTAKDLKQVLDADLAFLALDGDRPIGFSLALPDLNVALKRINGRLFPFGILKVLYHARKIKNVRVITMGVIDGYRNRGVDVLFYLATIENGIRRGYEWAELSWILEDNVPINKALEMIGGKVYKTYRIYDKALG
ncbi:MAG: N-acetyltransferase [bacterium]|nr:N-acetyltransferase [bacterium]